MDNDCEVGVQFVVQTRKAAVWVRVGVMQSVLTPAQAERAAQLLIRCATAARQWPEEPTPLGGEHERD